MMNKKELLKRVKDPKYIPGIFNYCDRWCERCPFTSRCLNHSIVEEKFGDLEERDEMNEEFWQRLSEIFKETLAMVKDMAKEHGIDIDSIELDGIDESEIAGKQNTLAHLFCHLAKKYEKAVDECFATKAHFLDESEGARNRLHLVSHDDKQGKGIISAVDAVEIIRWYQFQINIKLKRAVESTSEEEWLDSTDFPKDSDGSTKVALIGIDRSLSAWSVLLNRFTDHRNQIHHMIELLENIRKRVETHFPHARDFVRPGFDTEVY